MTSFYDERNVERLRGSIRPAPGGFTPVSCYLETVAFSINTQAQHPALWNALYDDPWNTNPLAAIPAGLGMTFAFDGTDATITTTVAGVWALAFKAQAGADATLAALLIDSFASATALVAGTAGFVASLTPVYVMPSGVTFAPNIDTTAAATGPALTAVVNLVIIRLA